MPSRSQAQQRFFGMVRAVQKGHVPLHSVGKHVQDAAKKMTPKDVSEFAATKHTGLPEHKSASLLDTCLSALILNKRADVQAALAKAEKALHQTGTIRRKALESHAEQLKKHNLKLQQQTQKAEMRAQKAELQASATPQGEVLPPPPPTPPAAQPPYGAMLMNQPQGQQGAQGTPGTPPPAGGAAGAAQHPQLGGKSMMPMGSLKMPGQPAMPKI